MHLIVIKLNCFHFSPKEKTVIWDVMAAAARKFKYFLYKYQHKPHKSLQIQFSTFATQNHKLTISNYVWVENPVLFC